MIACALRERSGTNRGTVSPIPGVFVFSTAAAVVGCRPSRQSCVLCLVPVRKKDTRYQVPGRRFIVTVVASSDFIINILYGTSRFPVFGGLVWCGAFKPRSLWHSLDLQLSALLVGACYRGYLSTGGLGAFLDVVTTAS